MMTAERDAAREREAKLQEWKAGAEVAFAKLQQERDAALARIERREKEWTRRYEELEAEGAANARLRAEFEAVCERGIGGYGPACRDLEARLRAALAEGSEGGAKRGGLASGVVTPARPSSLHADIQKKAPPSPYLPDVRPQNQNAKHDAAHEPALRNLTKLVARQGKGDEGE